MNIFRFLLQDKLVIGVIVGILFPGIFYVLFNEVNNLIIENNWMNGVGFSDKFLTIISACGNLIPFTIYKRYKLDRAMQGIVLDTLISFFFVLILFWGK